MSSLRNSYDRVSYTRGFFLRNLTLTGEFGGGEDANVNGSVTPVEFFVAPAANQTFLIEALHIILSDAGNPSVDGYGNIAGPLANGTQIFAELNNNVVNLGSPLVDNQLFLSLGELKPRVSFSGNIQVAQYDITFPPPLNVNDFSGLQLFGERGDRFGIRVQDDLTTLQSHVFTATGRVIDSNA